MNIQFGIHLGNSNVCLAVNRDSNIDVVSNKAGDRVTPTFLAILDSDEFVVGETAKQRAGRNPNSTIINNFQFCNGQLSDDDLAAALESVTCTLNYTSDFKYLLSINDVSKEVTPHEANIQFFHNVLSSAHQICHGDDQNALYPVVISIPDYFTTENSINIGEAAEEAGFKVEQLIRNSAAAVLAYNIGQEEIPKNETIMVYRVGGLTSECSIVNIENGLYEIENSIYRKHLGGHIFTKALADFIAEEFYNRYKLNPKESRRNMAKLFYYVEQSKHVLSTLPSTQIFIESLIDGVDVNSNISRARFESLISPHLSKFRKPIEELLESRVDKTKPIHRVILCGGSMKIPKLQSTISDMFKNSEILSTIPPDEVIAIGCARQASLNPSENIQDVEGFETDMEIVPFNIYIKKSNELEEEILAFPEGTQTYTVFKFNKTIEVDEDKIEFQIYEKRNESEIFNLGEIILDNKTNDKRHGEIEFVAILKPTLVEISFEKYV